MTLSMWGIMFAGIYVGAKQILGDSFLELEKRDALNSIQRLNSAINEKVDAVYLMTKNWAFWDDTYRFILNKNSQYIAVNLTPNGFAVTNVDFLAFFNSDIQLVWGGMLNLKHIKISGLPNDLLSDYLNPNGSLVHMPDTDSHLYGLLAIQQGIFFVAAHSIMHSNGSGVSRGAMIEGKFLSPQVLEQLKKLTELDIQIFPLKTYKKSRKLVQAEMNLRTFGSPYIATNNMNLDCYMMLRDINGKPIAIVKATIPRSVYKVGLATIRYFSEAFLGAGLLFTILLVIIFRFFITKRLERLNERIVEIGDKKAFSLRVPIEGADELTSVSQETNKMLDTIENYTHQQKALLDKVTALLEKVTDDEDFLNHIINAMPSILIITNSHLKVTHLNQKGEDETGLHHEQSLGLSLYDVLPYLSRFTSKIEDALNSKIPQMIDRIIFKTDLGAHYYNVLIYPFERGGEQVLALRIDDVSGRIRIEEQMSSNEKLASLGVLTAGIAHEINNPINFITSRISPLQNDLNDILAVLNKYAELNPDQPIKEQLDEIEVIKKELDLTYTVDEIRRLIEGLKEGATRTATIVKGLKVFSRLDEDTIKKVNIEEGIDSTLTLLKHKCQNRIELVKEYGHVPEVDCYPGKLNQVLMNIIANAIDAIPDKGEITITTEHKDNDVVIRIKDNGMGIPDEIKSKIFEPFFTTKDVGSGTGLGLSISFGIIRDHGGRIDVKSDVGKGAEFIITVPINHVTSKK